MHRQDEEQLVAYRPILYPSDTHQHLHLDPLTGHSCKLPRLQYLAQLLGPHPKLPRLQYLAQLLGPHPSWSRLWNVLRHHGLDPREHHDLPVG